MSFLKDFFVNVGTIGLAISLLLSLASCFFGYKLMKLWMAVAGFVLGFVLGDVVCALLKVESFGIFFLIGAVVGIVLAIVSFKLYKAGIFLLGAVLGSGITFLVLGTATWWYILAIIFAGIAVGALAVAASKPVVILASSISGGLSALQSAGALFALSALTGNASAIILWGGVALAVSGVVVQFITNKREPEKAV